RSGSHRRSRAAQRRRWREVDVPRSRRRSGLAAGGTKGPLQLARERRLKRLLSSNSEGKRMISFAYGLDNIVHSLQAILILIAVCGWIYGVVARVWGSRPFLSWEL